MKILKSKTFYGVNGRYLTVYTLLDFTIHKRISICVHSFHRGDEDPDCHDHPFEFWSLMLRGGYREYAEDGSFIVRRPLSLAYRSATHRHRVQLISRRCWTFIVKRDASREWGFWPNGQFVPWRNYIKAKGLAPIDDL